MKIGFTSATKIIDMVTNSKFIKVWEKKFVGADRHKAYNVLKSLPDDELKEMARLIEEVNRVTGNLPNQNTNKDDNILRNLVKRPLKVN